jgi:hypothetical protein
MSAPKNCQDWAEKFSDECVAYLHGCFLSGGKLDKAAVAAMARHWVRTRVGPDNDQTPRAPSDLALALCHEIERLPASEHQTQISLMASDLRREVEMLTIDKDTYRKAYEVTRNHEMMRGFKKANGL